MVNTSEIKNEKLKNNEATVQVMKQPKTFAQQVEIIKEKGFIIDYLLISFRLEKRMGRIFQI